MLKIGGAVGVETDAALDAVVALTDGGHTVVVVHGGGPLVGEWAERLCGVMSASGGDHRMQYLLHPITANAVRCVVVDVRLEQIEPMAHRFLLSFAKDSELRVRDGVAVRSKLAELQRVGDTA